MSNIRCGKCVKPKDEGHIYCPHCGSKDYIDADAMCAVHGLLHGRAVCAFTNMVPGDWPPGHRWAAAMTETAQVTCEQCRQMVTYLRGRV